MGRYDNNIVLNNTRDIHGKIGIRYRSTTRYPDIPLSNDDVFLQTIRGDRLDNLAYQFYGDSSLWWVISVANPELPNDSLYPTLGFQLRIPGNLEKILSDFSNLNS